MQLGTKIALGVAAGLGLYLATRKASAAASEPPLEPPSPSDPVTPPESVPPSQGTADLIGTTGKNWILTNKLAGKGSSTAANMGWYFKGPTFGGQAFEASVSLPGVRVIQGIGTKHDAAHSDYSQQILLCSQTATYQGQQRRISDLLVDPEASKLLSVEGPMQVLRQPGVPQLDAIATAPPASAVTRADVLALPDNLTKRHAIILSWAEQGLAEYDWVAVTTGDLTFYVMSDAMKFGGVRVNASATLEQQIADRLDCSLMTARMCDLTYAAATRIIPPFPLGASAQMASTAWMVTESDKMDAALAKLSS